MAEPAGGKAEACRCPYCDVEIEVREQAAFCEPCRIRLVECASCGKPVREGVETCPHCGGPMRK